LGSNLSRYIPVKGLVGSWLTPDRYQEGGEPGYKVMGRTQIHDRSLQYNQLKTSCSYALPVNLDRISKDSRRLFRRCGRRRCSCQHLSVYRKRLPCAPILVLTPPGTKAPSIVPLESGTILRSGVITPGVMRRHSLMTAVFSSQLPLLPYGQRHSPKRAAGTRSTFLDNKIGS
jgi:hypothetical protein